MPNLPRVPSADRQLGRLLDLLAEGVLNTALVANLPTRASVGSIWFATDALADGETTPGTGTLVYFTGTVWRRVCDDTTATI